MYGSINVKDKYEKDNVCVGRTGLCHMAVCPGLPKTAYGIKAAAGRVDVEVQFFTPSVVRVVKSPQGEHFEKKSLAVVASPGEVGVKVGIKDGAIVMDTKVLQVNLDTSTGAFFLPDG